MDICPPDIELEADIEIELETDIELEEEKAKAKEKEDSSAASNEVLQSVEDVFTYFENNISKLTKEQKLELRRYSEKMKLEVLISVIKEAIDYNAKSYKYVLTILQNCEKENILTLSAFHKRQEQHEKEKQQKNNGPNKKISFKDYEQRKYREGELNSLYMNRKVKKEVEEI